MPLLILESARPRQWTKNLLLYAGFLFTLGQQPPLPALLRATIAFALFSLLSASAYLVNDVRDRESDRHHPVKRARPVASGRLSPGAALSAAGILAIAGLAGAFRLNTHFGLAAAAYLAVTLSYSLRLKDVVLVDVITLALGYVLRAVAGAAAIDVPASFWLAVCTLLLALFLGLCKRRYELTSQPEEAPGRRETLKEYTEPLLDQLISAVTASALLAYALYTYFTPTAPRAALPWRFEEHLYTLTIPFVIYGIYRYLFLVYRMDRGGSPEALFLEDRALRWNTALWAMACVGALLAGRFVAAGELGGPFRGILG